MSLSDHADQESKHTLENSGGIGAQTFTEGKNLVKVCYILTEPVRFDEIFDNLSGVERWWNFGHQWL